MKILEKVQSKLINIFIGFICTIIGICIIFTFVNIIMYFTNTSPVEKNNAIDSLITVNDSLKLEVKHLDSIKNAKIIEIYNLNSDSTRRLFFELVSK